MDLNRKGKQNHDSIVVLFKYTVYCWSTCFFVFQCRPCCFLLPMGSVATAGFDGRLGLLSPLALMAVILCSYSRPSISSVDLYLVIVTGFLLARTHLSDLTSLRSMM